MQKTLVYVGTYSADNDSEGIYILELDYETGKIRKIGSASNSVNPSFLVVSMDGKFLYACEETGEAASISSYKIAADGAALAFMNTVSIPGKASCHIAVSPDGKSVIVSNFLSGNVVCCALEDDGSLGAMTCNRQHVGSSVRTDWHQDHARCHQTIFTQDGQYALVMDLGCDKIFTYSFMGKTGELHPWMETNTAPGDGPRHAVFHPNGRFLYVLAEISNQIILYDYDAESKKAVELQRVHTLPDTFTAFNNSSEITISQNGQYIFSSNRGHNSIVRFLVDVQTGMMSDRVHYPSEGDEPRIFVFDPCEKYFLLANQRSNEIIVRKYAPKTGEFLDICDRITIPSPSFIGFHTNLLLQEGNRV